MEADVDHGWLGEDVCEQKNSSGKRAGANLTCNTLHHDTVFHSIVHMLCCCAVKKL